MLEANLAQSVERRVIAKLSWRILPLIFLSYLVAVNVGQSTINATVSALRLLFGVTLERPDLSRRLVLARRPSKLPEMLSVEEGAKLLEAAPGIKYRAARRVAYAMGCACRRSSTSRSCGTCLRSAKTTGSFTQNRRSSAPKRSSPVCRATPTKSRSRTVA